MLRRFSLLPWPGVAAQTFSSGEHLLISFYEVGQREWIFEKKHSMTVCFPEVLIGIPRPDMGRNGLIADMNTQWPLGKYQLKRTIHSSAVDFKLKTRGRPWRQVH